MKKLPNRYKLLIIIILLLGLAGAAFFWLYQEKERPLEVIFMDVGQGDAILIKTPNKQQILIDGGPDDRILAKLGKHMPFLDKTIDLVVLTHPHADHVGGLVSVMENYRINQVFYTGVDYPAEDYLAWLEVIAKKGITSQISQLGDQINLGDQLTFSTIYPLGALTNKELEDVNSPSIVNRLVYGRHSFLFMGDLPAEEEKEILEHYSPIDSDIFKVGHHGSKYSSSQEFLDAVSPVYSIIQSGKDNRFGHPHLAAILRLEKTGTKILRNDQFGDIKCQTNAEVLSCFAL